MEQKYAVILGNLGNTRDRFCSGYKQNPSTLQMLQSATAIPHVSGVELVGTWDIGPHNVRQMHSALRDLGLQCVSIIPDLFTEPLYGKGSLCSTESGVRRQAMDYIRSTCDIAGQLECSLVNLWPGQDGYDYLLAADYERERDLLCQAVAEIAESHSELRFSLEYKPKEPRTHSYLARMGDTLLLALETGCANVGVTIDTGHALIGGEVIGESIVLARRAGNRLFHMHFNDNHTTTDDDMIVGSVHFTHYLETLFWLDRCEYSGWLSMDQYPYREDAAGAIGESILWVKHFADLVEVNRARVGQLLLERNAVATSRFLRSAIVRSPLADEYRPELVGEGG